MTTLPSKQSCAKIVILYGLLSLLISCGSTTSTKKTKSHHNLSSHELYQQGLKKLNAWEQGDKGIQTLKLATELLSKALDKNPQNVYYQLAHYNARYQYAASRNKFSEETLLTLFNKLNPILHQEVATPAFQTYIQAQLKSDSLDKQQEHIVRAIKQNPYNPQNWITLSRVYEAKKQFWLGAAAARQALDIFPNTPYYQFQVGMNLEKIALNRLCIYDEKNILQRASSYMTKATAQNINDPTYLDNQGLQYLQLGLIPLAYHQTKKSFELQPQIWTAIHYAESALLMKKYGEVENAAKYLIDSDAAAFGHSLLAMTSISKHQLPEAITHMRNASNPYNAFFYAPAQIWLLNYSKTQRQALYDQIDTNVIANNPILSFLQKNTHISEEDFLKNSPSTCARSTQYFFRAQKYWQKGDNEKAKEYLLKTKQLGAIREYTYLWANVLLNSRYAN